MIARLMRRILGMIMRVYDDFDFYLYYRVLCCGEGGVICAKIEG